MVEVAVWLKLGVESSQGPGRGRLRVVYLPHKMGVDLTAAGARGDARSKIGSRGVSGRAPEAAASRVEPPSSLLPLLVRGVEPRKVREGLANLLTNE